MSRAPSPSGVAPAATSASQTSPARSGSSSSSTPGSPGVAGPAHQHRHARHGPPAAVHARRRAGRPPVRRTRSTRARALHGQHRELVAAIDDVGVEVRRVALEPLQVTLVVGGVGDGDEARTRPAGSVNTSSSTPPSGVQMTLYCAPPSGSRRTSLESRCWSRACAPGPAVSIWPMWETSNTPARVAHGLVLGPDPVVLEWHLPAGELDQLGARRAVAVVERAAAEGVGRRGHVKQANTCPRRFGRLPAGRRGRCGRLPAGRRGRCGQLCQIGVHHPANELFEGQRRLPAELSRERGRGRPPAGSARGCARGSDPFGRAGPGPARRARTPSPGTPGTVWPTPLARM